MPSVKEIIYNLCKTHLSQINLLAINHRISMFAGLRAWLIAEEHGPPSDWTEDSFSKIDDADLLPSMLTKVRENVLLSKKSTVVKVSEYDV